MLPVSSHDEAREDRYPEERSDARTRWLVITASLLVVLGAKIWLIAVYGSATPFWDQWDAEAAALYPRYLAGTLHFPDLLASHNEHRILLTRLVALAVFVGSGRWDPILQMMINALLHTAGIGLLLVVLSRILDRAGTALLAFFFATAFAVPFGWGNALSAFQSQFYLLVLLGPLALLLFYNAVAWSARWWLATIVAVAAYFSIAPGALTVVAFIGVAITQLVVGRRAGRSEWLGVALHVLLAAALIYDVPRIPEHDVVRVHSALAFMEALLAVASWPVASQDGSLLSRSIGALLLYTPVLIMTLQTLRKRPPLSHPLWLLLGLAGWIGALLAAAAYGRGMSALETRYSDIFIIGVVLNAACLFWLVRDEAGAGRYAFAAVWLLAVVMGGGGMAFDDVARGLAWRRDTAAIETENVKQFIATGNASVLQNKPPFDIPFPSAEKLIDYLSDPAIRAILPANLRGEVEVHSRRDIVLHHGALLIPLGLALFMIAGMAGRAPMRPRR
jgi:hypothetical protein